MMKKFFINLFLGCCVVTGMAHAKPAKSTSMDHFIHNLMAKMTLDEKIGQLNLPGYGDLTTGLVKSTGVIEKIKAGEVGGLFNIMGVDKIRAVQKIAVEQTRLKIPLIIGMDVIHGYETVFPIPLGLSCTWDMKSIEETAHIAAIEASASGVCWTYSPMVDIARDPRWGRISEGAGEDPYLGGQVAKAMVRGYQGGNRPFASDSNIMSCVKHFALYGAVEAGREYNTVDMSRESMYNNYLYPYKAAVEAGVGSVMSSFNVIDGIPASGNKWLLTDLLRKQWGFKGFVVTDYTAINEMEQHGMGDLKTCSAMALNAGVDMDMVGEGYLTTIKRSLKEGTVSMKQIDDACYRILEAKYKLGLFANPYRFLDKKRALHDIYTPQNRAFSRKVAAESFVLLKNDHSILPLAKKGTIAVVGPLAAPHNNIGSWSVAAKSGRPLNLVEGLRQAVGNQANIVYAPGSNLVDDSMFQQRVTDMCFDKRTPEQMIDEAVRVAQNADVIVAAVGEGSGMSGEAESRTDIRIPRTQRQLLKKLATLGKPVVIVLYNGRPLDLSWENKHVDAILDTWFGGTQASEAIADVLFGAVNPSAKLTTTFPQNIGQIPLYYNHLNTGRPQDPAKWYQHYRSNYMDVTNLPLYPFGYGLSYTHYTYGNIHLSSTHMDRNGFITASISVTNSGQRDGDEIVQLYTHDLAATLARPVQELKGFQRIALKAGETKQVTFKITPPMLGFYNSQLKFVTEPGDFDLMIGANSADVKTVRFHLN